MPSNNASDAQILYSIVVMVVVFLTSMIFETVQKNKNRREFIKNSIRSKSEDFKE